MDPEYVKLSSPDEFINPHGVCIICGEDGLHEACESEFCQEREARNDSIRKQELKLKETEAKFLREYSVVKDYGIIDHKMFSKAKSSVKKRFPLDHSYDSEKEIENLEWFFVPYFYIGCLGYIVVKSSFKIYPIGSVYQHIWCGVEAFEKGVLDEGEL